jgi:putative oxidoreductase
MNILRIVKTEAPAATLLIRLAVGVVFASEGIQKFLFADAQGAGRFAKIGIPAPDVMGPFVGVVEIACGALVLAGLLTRLAAIPLVINMLVAIASTKVPILLGHGYWLFEHTFAPKAGFWSFLHESRTDLAMLLGSAFLLIVGGGAWSVDAVLQRLSGHARRGGMALVVLGLTACSRDAPDAGLPKPSKTIVEIAPSEAWVLAGTDDERFARVAKHLRGFDVAMVETGYRYGELYWAGMDQNWEYAKYQLAKIDTAVRNGIERRPKRARSAQMLEGALGGVTEAIQAKDGAMFAKRFEALTETCNACHRAEQVSFVHVVPPSIRASPVGPFPEGSPR